MIINTGSRSVVAFVSNAQSLYLANPSKASLQALFDHVKHQRESEPGSVNSKTEGYILRGVIGERGEQHHWGDARKFIHKDLDDRFKKTPDADFRNRTSLHIKADGKVLDYKNDPYLGWSMGDLKK